MTPAYTDGGRTPQYTHAWDPSVVPATPARSVMNEDNDEEDRFSMRTPAYASSEIGKYKCLFLANLTQT
jgi:hypothetical protein